MRTLSFVFFCVLWIAVGCQDKAESNRQNELVFLQKQVEDVHDEAMKQLADMNRVARNLKTASENPANSASRKDSILDVLTNMQKAEEDMYAWMTSYKAPATEAAPADAKQYLEGQKVLIDKNYNDIEAAIRAGKLISEVKE